MAVPLREILDDRFPRRWIRKEDGKSWHHATHSSLHLTWPLRPCQASDVQNIEDPGHLKQRIWEAITSVTPHFLGRVTL
jgi:hypothetical protein